MIRKFKNIYYGFLIGIFILTLLTIGILKQNKILMNIELIDNFKSIKIDDKYIDNYKLKTILSKEILNNEIDFEKDIQKTLNYVATIVQGRYKSNLNLTAYQKLNNILTQNGGGDLW